MDLHSLKLDELDEEEICYLEEHLLLHKRFNWGNGSTTHKKTGV